MEQNIHDVCSTGKVIINNISNIIVRKCCNDHCIENTFPKLSMSIYAKICKKCGNIICYRCISNNYDRCVICLFPNIKFEPNQRCKNCGKTIEIYVCKKCDKLILYCVGDCKYSMSTPSNEYHGYCCTNCNDYDKSFAKFIKFNEIECQ